MDFYKELLNYGVSRETFAKIEQFVSLILLWNKKMNLISKKTEKEIWLRHVMDSSQLIEYLPETKFSMLDIGSGSGFPGVVLAILLQQKNPEATIELVESIAKKTLYLNAVVSELDLKNTTVHNERIENGKYISPNIITARAVAVLNKLFEFTRNTVNSETELLLLKGKTYETEILEAQKHWNFRYKVYKNKYSNDGVILRVTDLRKKR